MLPTSQGCCAYQALARCSVQRVFCAEAAVAERAAMITAEMKADCEIFTMEIPTGLLHRLRGGEQPLPQGARGITG